MFTVRWRALLGAGHRRVAIFAAAAIVAAIACLWLRTGFPVVAKAELVHDDALFVRLSRTITSGHWLGTFDNRTLVKGVGYPLFIASCFIAGISLKIGDTILYLVSAFGMSLIVLFVTKRTSSSLLVLIMLSFNPVVYSPELARVIRDSFYLPLSLLTILFAFVLIFKDRSKTIIAEVTLIGSAGFIWAWYWVTREEGVWLAPSLMVLVAGGLVQAHRRRQTVFKVGKLLAIRLFASLGVAACLISCIAALNYRYFGVFETVEVKSPAFERAYGAIDRVRPAHWVRYVVFPRDVRQKVYSISPAARELIPSLEGENGNNWRLNGCRFSVEPGCPEIIAAFFQWAFRDAVANAGHYRTAATAAAYYDRLGSEIDAACDNGQLDCTPNRHSLAPKFRWEYLTDALRLLPSEALVFWRDGLHVMAQPPSTGSMSDYSAMADVVGPTQPLQGSPPALTKASRMRNAIVDRIASMIAAPYRWLFLVLFLLSLIYVLPIGFAKVRRYDGAYFLVLASFVAVLSRMALLAYLDVTAIPSIHILYESSASGFLILGASLGAAQAAHLFVRNHPAPL